jgi:hypothetical protein
MLVSVSHIVGRPQLGPPRYRIIDDGSTQPDVEQIAKPPQRK